MVARPRAVPARRRSLAVRGGCFTQRVARLAPVAQGQEVLKARATKCEHERHGLRDAAKVKGEEDELASVGTRAHGRDEHRSLREIGRRRRQRSRR